MPSRQEKNDLILPSRFDPTELVLLVIVIVSALIAIKVLLDLSSRHHRSRYTRTVRLDLIIGVLLGASLPWAEAIGLAAAAIYLRKLCWRKYFL